MDSPPRAEGNHLPSSEPGIHVAHGSADWTLQEWALEDYAEELGLEKDECLSLPDLLVDPDSRILSAVNTSTTTQSYFISTSHPLHGADHKPLRPGSSRDQDGAESVITTLVLKLKPRTVLEACFMDVSAAQALGEEAMDLFSDIKEVRAAKTLGELESEPLVLSFPLQGHERQEYFSCCQGMGGSFTHFYHATYHAIDLLCPTGTPVVAVADGVITEVKQDSHVTGIHARNLFAWNSLSLRIDGSACLIEYVHIKAESALVAVGDHVKQGQVLCLSGDVGFCPMPHLHFQVLEGEAADAATVPFQLLGDDGPYVPQAGRWYGVTGEMPPG